MSASGIHYNEDGTRDLWFGDFYGLGWRAANSGKYDFCGSNEKLAIKMAINKEQKHYEMWSDDDKEEFTSGWKESKQ
tara:strand:+ start:429 stop:659 length:231 start_codon:yes stop_codon:yes gene_type:complete